MATEDGRGMKSVGVRGAEIKAVALTYKIAQSLHC